MDDNGNNGTPGNGGGIGEPPVSVIGGFDLLGRPIGGDGNSDARTVVGVSDGSGIPRGIRSTGESINGIPVGDAGGNSGPVESGDSEPSGEYGYRKDGTPAKRRGRKPGSGSARADSGKSASKKTPSSVKGLEKILFSVHAIVAVKAGAPEFIIDSAEANMLASAINDVQEFYGLEVSPEVTIWVNLVTALGTVYGPRVVTMYARKKKERADKPKETKQPAQRATSGNPFDGITGLSPPIPGLHSGMG